MSEESKDPEKEIKFKVDQQVKDFYDQKYATAKIKVQSEEDQSKPKLEDTVQFESKDEVVYASEPTTKESSKVEGLNVFFDYKSDFFSELMEKVDKPYKAEIVKEFEKLPLFLKDQPRAKLFLNLNAYTKLCRQLIPKVKEKFENVELILVAKDLDQTKIEELDASDLSCDHYLSSPFDVQSFINLLEL